jgi:hypothetical protein
VGICLGQSDRDGSTVSGNNGVAVLERAADTNRFVGFVPLDAVFPSGFALKRDGTLLLVAVKLCSLALM